MLWIPLVEWIVVGMGICLSSVICVKIRTLAQLSKWMGLWFVLWMISLLSRHIYNANKIFTGIWKAQTAKSKLTIYLNERIWFLRFSVAV